jgi:NitT/TauT family transport system permease protein
MSAAKGTAQAVAAKAPAKQRRSRGRSDVLAWQILLVVVLLGSWQLLSGPVVDPFWVSRPSDILVYIYDWVFFGDFFRHLSFTLAATFLGFALGASTGFALGLVLGRAEFWARVLDPFLVAINGIPRVALAPLFVVWFGIGLLPKVVLVFTLVFFVIFYNTYSGVRSVERHYVDLAWVMGADDRTLFRKVMLPAAMPYIFLGVKLSIPYALIGAIIGEFVASSAGLGWKIQVETSLYNTTGTMAGLVILMTIVMIMNWGLDHAERHVLSWRPRQRGASADIT